jgi:hypothetical protein
LSLKSQIRKLLTGITVPQEYCCLDLEQMAEPLKVILTTQGNMFAEDITNSHLFLGYKPLIIGLSFANKSPLSSHESICLSLVQQNFSPTTTWHGYPTDRSAIARMILRKVHEIEMDDRCICLYEGVSGAHTFLSPVHQATNNALEKFRSRSASNVSLTGNLFDQVRIAYAVPRKISIITVSDGIKINLFPTDLHGQIDAKLYAGSLRIGGKANEQVEGLKRAVISDVDAAAYKETYALGKNHMNVLQDESDFALHQKKSRTFGFPLPASVVRYRELTLLKSIDHGIHRLHFYQIANEEILGNSSSTLAHIQQYYAQWRIDHSLPTTLLFR